MRQEHEVPPLWLGHYERRSFIARGGMGEVWLAAKDGTGKPCVVKVLRREFARDPEYRRRFFREAEILSLLNHGRIVSVLDHGECQGWLYIVMDYVDGVDLGRFCRALFGQGEIMPVEVVAYFAGEVLEALRHAHERAPGQRPLRIIHRDVTPGNVLVSSEGELFVTDFGLARQSGDLSGDVFGTLEYMAPEQYEGRACIQSDLYGVGGLILFMLTGRPPRKVKNATEMLANLRPEIGPLGRDDVPEPLERLLRICLEPDLAKRLRSARDGIRLLDSWKLYSKKTTVTSLLYQQHVGPKRTGMTGLVRSAPALDDGIDAGPQARPTFVADGVAPGLTLRVDPERPIPQPEGLEREETVVLGPPGGAAKEQLPVDPPVEAGPQRPAVPQTEPARRAPPAVTSAEPPILATPSRPDTQPETPAAASSEAHPPALLWRPWWSETHDVEDCVTTRFVPPRHPRPRSLPPSHLAEPDAPRLFRRQNKPPSAKSGEPGAPPATPHPATERLPPPFDPPPSPGPTPTTPPRGMTERAMPSEPNQPSPSHARGERGGDPSASSAGRPDAVDWGGAKALVFGVLVAGALVPATASVGERGSPPGVPATAEASAASSTQAALPSRPAPGDARGEDTP